MNLPHYNSLFLQQFEILGLQVVYQPSCLVRPYDGICWPIQFPDVKDWNHTVVIMHCQDFVSIKDNTCPELELIEKHFGKYSNRVVVIHWNINLQSVYKGTLNLIHFPTHSYELLINLKKEFNCWIQNFQRPRSKIWQCLNGVPRQHRKLVVNHIQNLPNGIVSLSEKIPLPSWSYNNYYGCENEKNWQKLQYVYTDCDINIVTETQYSETPGIISEKTLMAFLAQQVPIVIGYKGIVKHCEELGFDMFRDLVDSSYDFEDNSTRWRSAIDLNKTLLQNGIDRDSICGRLEKNLNTVLNLPQIFVKNYQQCANCIIRENFLNLSKD